MSRDSLKEVDYNKTYAVPGSLWNQVVRLIKRSQFEVAPPLKKLMEGSEGFVLGCGPTAAPGPIFVQLQQSGGTNATYTAGVNGSAGTLNPASYRYDLYPPGQYNASAPLMNCLAQSVPLLTPRFQNVGMKPATWGWAIINPSIPLISPGNVPGSVAETPYRLTDAYETRYEVINCIPNP